MIKQILIDIKNNPTILQLILDTIPYMEGWIASINVAENFLNPNGPWKEYPSRTARYFSFDLDNKRFEWYKYDHRDPEEDYSVIRTEAQATRLLNGIYDSTKPR